MSKLILRGKCQELLDNNGLTGYHVDVQETYHGNKMQIVTECGKPLVVFETIQFATKIIKSGEIVYALELLEQFLLKERKNIRTMHNLENQITTIDKTLSAFGEGYKYLATGQEHTSIRCEYLTKHVSINVACVIEKGKFTPPSFRVIWGDASANVVKNLKTPELVIDTLNTMLVSAKKIYKLRGELSNLRSELSSCKI